MTTEHTESDLDDAIVVVETDDQTHLVAVSDETVDAAERFAYVADDGESFELTADELLERLHVEADTALTALRRARDEHDAESKRRREALNTEIVTRRAELNTQIAGALDESQRRGRALAAYRRGK